MSDEPTGSWAKFFQMLIAQSNGRSILFTYIL
jgi:hypothetical protein